MGPDVAFIAGSDFLMDRGVTAGYWFGELASKSSTVAAEPWTVPGYSDDPFAACSASMLRRCASASHQGLCRPGASQGKTELRGDGCVIRVGCAWIERQRQIRGSDVRNAGSLVSYHDIMA